MLWRKAKRKDRGKRQTLGTSLRMEVLESRAMLTGVATVEVVDGSLVIKALNDDDTKVEITQDVTGSSTYFVKGVDGTLVNGLSGKQEFTGVNKDIDARFKDGQDEIKLKTGVEVHRDLLVKGGEKVDTVILQSDVVVGRDVNLKMGKNSDVVDLKGNNDIGRDLIVKGDNGSDEVKITDATIGRNVNLNLGKGDNVVKIDPTEIDKNLTVKSTGTLDLELDATTVKGKTNITGGGSDDDVTIKNGSDLQGDVNINLKNGYNDVVIKESELGSKFNYRGGNDMDTMAIDDADFGGKVTIATRGGTDNVEIERSGSLTGKSNFNGTTDIDLGKGDSDVLKIGKGNGDTRAKFFADLYLDGGAGFLDELNLLGNGNDIMAGLMIDRFEVIS